MQSLVIGYDFRSLLRLFILLVDLITGLRMQQLHIGAQNIDFLSFGFLRFEFLFWWHHIANKRVDDGLLLLNGALDLSEVVNEHLLGGVLFLISDADRAFGSCENLFGILIGRREKHASLLIPPILGKLPGNLLVARSNIGCLRSQDLVLERILMEL